MSASLVLAEMVEWPAWIAPALVGAAFLTLICWRLLPRVLVWMGFTLCLSAALALQIIRTWPTAGGAVQDVARICAVLTLAWSVCAAVVARGRRHRAVKGVGHGSFAEGSRVVALLLGVTTAILQSVVLTMRIVFVGVDLLNGYPHIGVRAYGFAPEGLWSLGFLFAACTIAQVSTGDRRLGTCQLWCAAMAVTWACLLAPALRSTETGGCQHTGNTLVLLAALSVLLALTVTITGLVERRGRRREREADGAASSSPPWPGLSSSFAVIALVVIILVSYHLAVPITASWGGFRLAVLIAVGSAALAALASFLMVARTWSAPVADVAMALTSLGLCGLATLAVPSKPTALVERYPMVFNAMIFGLAGATGLWTWLRAVWLRQQAAGLAGAATGRLIPHARQFAFLSAALALVIAAVMAVWPRWRAIATADDSVGRVTAGVSANLFLLLVLLWCSRRFHKLTFQILTVLAVVSTAGFLLARILPFSPRFG